MTRAASSPPADQATRLRALVSSLRAADHGAPAAAAPIHWSCPFVVVASGKGGVGKSCLSILLARACAESGHETLLADADLGAANLDVLLRASARRRIDSLWRGHDHSLAVPTALGFRLIAGVSGGAPAEAHDRRCLLAGLARESHGAAMLLADVGAGLGHAVLEIAEAAHLIALVATPDPASITDAYALFKTLAPKVRGRFGVIVNQARDDAEGVEIHRRIALAGERFIGTRPALLGVMTENDALRRAARTQRMGEPGAFDDEARGRARACAGEVCRLAQAAWVDALASQNPSPTS